MQPTGQRSSFPRTWTARGGRQAPPQGSVLVATAGEGISRQAELRASERRLSGKKRRFSLPMQQDALGNQTQQSSPHQGSEGGSKSAGLGHRTDLCHGQHLHLPPSTVPPESRSCCPLGCPRPGLTSVPDPATCGSQSRPARLLAFVHTGPTRWLVGCPLLGTACLSVRAACEEPPAFQRAGPCCVATLDASTPVSQPVRLLVAPFPGVDV